MVAAGTVVYLVPDLLGAVFVGLGAAALFVGEDTYYRRKREALSLLAKIGLRGKRPGDDSS